MPSDRALPATRGIGWGPGLGRALGATLGFLRAQPFALVGLAIYATFILVAVFADLIATHDPRQIMFSGAYRVARYLPPSATHWLGTTAGGRDIFSQLVHGTRSALTVGITAAICVVALGSLLGLLSGYLGGWVDRLVMRLADVVLGLPFLPFVLVISALTHAGTDTLVASVALLLWPNTARVIRSQVLSLRERGWVEAARVTGCSRARIIFVHIAPQVAPLAALYGSIAVGWAILTEASASFLGFGDPAAISWGLMLQDAFANQALSRGAWNWFVPPGLCVVLLVLAGFLISRGSEKLLFPKLGD
ncbi:ABC transporter permease [Roseomonas sp. OT10]|uniref:ABC transporter permease n=1 Tax=Roseomonas cutis TaxID=2897332 RepID=UPI001E393D30|nr:ABC transporter permease [Roseomonas sp. OT10]UFN48920.1 ABC transporter permease [Roseomonas sp. OT10]